MTTNTQKIMERGTSQWKRSSIMNSLIMDKSQIADKCQRLSQKELSSLKKSKRMAFDIKQYKFQPFDLKQLQDNHALIKNNRKFSSLLDTLKIYNQKVIDGRQNDVVNYKLYDFFYSTLKICNTKTETQVQFYLRQVDQWLHKYSHKRQLIIRPNKKKNSKKGQQQLIRQTFKSNLPLEIDQYQRKVCALPTAKNTKIQAMGDYLSKRDQKFKSTSGKMFQDSQESDGQNYVRKIRDSTENDSKDKLKKEDSYLPNLRAYKMEIMKMRKIIQQREQKKLLENLKRNQSRIQTQSSNNFYKPLKNRNDIFNKTSNALGIQKNLDDQFKIQSRDGDNQSRRTSKVMQTIKNIQKQNQKVIVNSTTMGFYQIKKNNLNNILGQKKSQTFNQLPRFFMNGATFHNLKGFQISQSEQNTQTQFEKDVTNIQGLNLLRNPFQILKTKTKKKK